MAAKKKPKVRAKKRATEEAPGLHPGAKMLLLARARARRS
jgi:hypothetical protein